MDDWIGYQWLAQRYGIKPVQALRTDSAIAKSRSTVRDDGHVHECYPPAARPAPTLAGHLTFAFKHEGIHLEFLARLFAVLPVGELEAWMAAEPTGQYARRAGFFSNCSPAEPWASPGRRRVTTSPRWTLSAT